MTLEHPRFWSKTQFACHNFDQARSKWPQGMSNPKKIFVPQILTFPHVWSLEGARQVEKGVKLDVGWLVSGEGCTPKTGGCWYHIWARNQYVGALHHLQPQLTTDQLAEYGILIRGAGTRVPTLASPHLPAPLKAYLAG